MHAIARLASGLILVALIVIPIPVAEATFPGNNGLIAFVSDRDGDSEIYTMNPDGTGLMQLTVNTVDDNHPSFSADGAKIAFASTRDGNWEIYSMNADGTGQVRLTNDPALEQQPGWSPDGTKITFNSDRDGNAEIYVMNADGTGPTRLTTNLGHDNGAEWSPSGTQIVFNSNRDDPNFEIYTMDADGTGQTRLTTSVSTQDVGPAWSPDGSQIVWRRDFGGCSSADLWVMNADGSSPAPLVCAPAHDGEGVISPDGTKIAFGNFRTGNTEIYVRDVGGAEGTETQITFDPGFDGAIDWQPVDATPPTITITTPANGASYTLGSTVYADYSCDDPGGSGIATCAGPVADGAPIDTGTVGPKSFTVNATDNAGNASSLTHNYTVVYAFDGFFSPVDNLPVLNSVRAGASVPVKFSLNGDQELGIFATGYPKSEAIACDSTAPVDGVEETLTAGSTGLSYDASLDQYEYVWKTAKAWAGTCRQLVVMLADGSAHRANFKLK